MELSEAKPGVFQHPRALEQILRGTRLPISLRWGGAVSPLPRPGGNEYSVQGHMVITFLLGFEPVVSRNLGSPFTESESYLFILLKFLPCHSGRRNPASRFSYMHCIFRLHYN